eukprot:3796218-Amphidinium_carterae.1
MVGGDILRSVPPSTQRFKCLAGKCLLCAALWLSFPAPALSCWADALRELIEFWHAQCCINGIGTAVEQH